MALIVGNNHLGALASFKNGIYESKSSISVRAVSIYPKPILGIHFNCVLVNKRLDNYRVYASSIEKELKFSPSFSDYVKIMESVKLDRSKNSDDIKGNKEINGLKNQLVIEKEREKPKDFTKMGNKRNFGSIERIGNKGFEGEKFGYNSFDAKKERENDSYIKPKNSTKLGNNRNSGSIERKNERENDLYNNKERRFNNTKYEKEQKIGYNNFERKNERENDLYNNRENKFKNTQYEKEQKIGYNNFERKNERENGLYINRERRFNNTQYEKEQKFGYNNFERKNENRNDLYINRERRFDNTQYERGQFDKLIEPKNSPNNKFINKSDSFTNLKSEKGYNISRKNQILNLESAKDSKFERLTSNYTAERSKEIKDSKIFRRESKSNGTDLDEIKDSKIFRRESKSSGTDLDEIKNSKIFRRESKYKPNGTNLDERAAFKTFEVFTDVNNRPRVLRMEMEERIQKLASRLNATDVNMPAWQFSKLMHDAKIKFSDHTILRVVHLLGTYGNWRRALQVLQWLQSGEKFNSLKSRYIYTTVLDVLGKAKRPLEALNVFHSMREEFGSYPDIAAYRCIAVTLGQAGLIKELFDCMDCMRKIPDKKFNLKPIQKWDPRLEPDLVVYNSVINACVQQKQWEGAFWVLQQLKDKSIKPTNTTYGLVMEVMLVCEKYNLVYEFFNKVKKSNIPSALNYKVLINAFWREGRIEEAIAAVREMERKGIVGSASLYYDFARCLCTAGRCQDALLQVDKICKVAKKPLVVTYTGLIQACIDSNNMKNARYIFNKMQKYCSPNVITCNIMVKSYLQNNMFDEARDLFYEIINGLNNINDKSDLKGKVVPDKFIFNIMMEACAKNKKWEDFSRVFLQMLHHGHHFDVRRHLKMVMDAFRDGKVEVLEATWDHLVSFNRTPPVPIIMEKFCLKLKEGNVLSALSCIRNFEESELQNISSRAWLNLLSNNKDYLEEKMVVKLIKEISGVLENECESVLYRNVLNGCNLFLSGGSQSDSYSLNFGDY